VICTIHVRLADGRWAVDVAAGVRSMKRRIASICTYKHNHVNKRSSSAAGLSGRRDIQVLRGTSDVAWPWSKPYGWCISISRLDTSSRNNCGRHNNTPGNDECGLR
jgi:hypothetical protein